MLLIRQIIVRYSTTYQLKKWKKTEHSNVPKNGQILTFISNQKNILRSGYTKNSYIHHPVREYFYSTKYIIINSLVYSIVYSQDNTSKKPSS